MRLSMVMWTALAVVVGISLFLLKYQVQGLEDQLHATYAQIEKDKSAIRVLEAEWTYLNDPGRLRRLSEQHLGFTAPNAKQVATMAQLPYREGHTPTPEGVSLPSTPENTLQSNPVLRTTSLERELETQTTQSQLSAFFIPAAAVSERPSAIAATFARLQRMIPPTWSGATFSQEPSR